MSKTDEMYAEIERFFDGVAMDMITAMCGRRAAANGDCSELHASTVIDMAVSYGVVPEEAWVELTGEEQQEIEDRLARSQGMKN